MDATRAKVTSNGQVSLPAELRHRWATGAVLVIDRGNYAIVRPIPTDPLATLRGAHAGPGPTTDQARAAERMAEQQREHRGNAAATALSTGRPLATADPPLVSLIRAEEGKVHALPDTTGRLP